MLVKLGKVTLHPVAFAVRVLVKKLHNGLKAGLDITLQVHHEVAHL